MADNKDYSNTMEINSILEEAHARQNPTKVAPARHVREDTEVLDLSRRTTVSPENTQGNDDDFVFVDESGSYSSARSSRDVGEPQKKSKKTLVITLIVVGVVLLAGICGFIAWRISQNQTAVVVDQEMTFPANTTISGVNVGGMNAAQAKAALVPVEQKLADSIRVEVTAGDKKVTLTKADFRYHFNTDEVIKKTQEGASGQEVQVIIEDSSYPAVADAVAKQIDSEPKDASVKTFDPGKNDMFTYAKEQNGQKLKADEFQKQLRSLFGGGKVAGTIPAPVEEKKPAITEEYLKKNIKKLSSFDTYSTNTSNAMSNQALSLSSCNGSIIEPGATWSFNNCTGDSNLESNGYLPAGVIVQGRHEIGIGGGICQSSTTIYNAGILCGMTVVERECHYYPSSYVDYGRDATIDYGNIDLKLKNPFKYQLFLKCWMDGVVLNAEIYGLPAEDFDEIRVSTSDPSYFSTGYTVTASRTYYKDGKAVRSEELPSSTYYFSAPSGGSSSSKPTSSSGSSSSGASSGSSSGVDDPSSTTSQDPGPDSPGGDEPVESGGDEPVESGGGEPDPGGEGGEPGTGGEGGE